MISQLNRLPAVAQQALGGSAFGLLVVAAVFVLLAVTGAVEDAGPASFIARAHTAHPLLYVIDLLPVFFALTAVAAGTRLPRERRTAASLSVDFERRTESLKQALAEAQRANEMIAYASEHDPLTGLYNRRHFQKELARWLAHAARYKHAAAVLYVELDQFRRVTDVLGHAGGETYVLSATDILNRHLRSTDMVARWGDEQFVLLLPECNKDGAVEVAKKILLAFGDGGVSILGGDMRMSASIGIAVFPDHGAHPVELVAAADVAMRDAKRSGRNCWNVYSEVARERARSEEWIRWDTRLRQALDGDQFVIEYQPVVAIESGETEQYEALLRLEDRFGHRLNAGSFLPYAEQYGLGDEIDRLVIRKVAQRLAGLGPELQARWMTLNLGEHAIKNLDIVDYALSIAERHELPPTRLGFEVSEAFAVKNLGRVREAFTKLRQAGFRLVLDDFGLSFTSFYYLQRFSVDAVKIDGALMRGIKFDGEKRRYIENLAANCRGLGIKTVGKYVEEPQVIDTLRNLGLDYAQGYAIGRPIEALEQAALAQ